MSAHRVFVGSDLGGDSSYLVDECLKIEPDDWTWREYDRRRKLIACMLERVYFPHKFGAGRWMPPLTITKHVR